MSHSLGPHGWQRAGLPCLPLSPGVCSSSCSLSWWCYPTISTSSVLFSLCLQSFPASGSFTLSQLFASGGQNIGVSALASVLPVNIQGWFPLELTCLISLQSKGFSRVFSSITVGKHQFFCAQPSLWFNFHVCPRLLEKQQLSLDKALSAKWCICFLILCLGLSWLFFQWACLIILWLQSPSTVTLEPKKAKSTTVSTFPPSICHEVMGLDARILIFWMLSFKPAFSLSSFTFIKRLFVPLHFLPWEWYHLHIWGCISLGPWICCGLGGCTGLPLPPPGSLQPLCTS